MANKQEKTAENSVEPQKSKKKSKICRHLFCTSAAIIGLPSITLILALCTEAGQQGIIRLADKMLDSLAIEQIRGNLAEGLELQHLRYQIDGVDTLVENARLQLNVSCLWQREICLEDISLTNPRISIDTSKLATSAEPNQSSEMKRIKLPIAVKVSNVTIKDLNLVIDQNQLNLGYFHTALNLNNEQGFTLAPTQIDDLQVISHQHSENEKTAEKKPEPNQPIDWNALEQQFNQPLLANLQQVTLPFDLHLQDIQGKNWQYEQFTDDKLTQQIAITHWQLQADSQDDLVKLQTLTLDSSLGSLQSAGQIQLSGDFPLDLQLQAKLNDIKQNKQILLPATQLDLQLSKNLKKSSALLLKSQGGVNAELQAEVQLNEAKLPLQLQLRSQALQYPFNASADPLKVEKLDLQLQGDLFDYQLQLNAAAQGMGMPYTKLELQGKGGLSAANIEKLQLNALNGSLNLAGNADWKNGVQWNIRTNVDKINLGAYLKDFPAILSGDLSADGFANPQEWQVNVSNLDLQGNLSGRVLSLKGEFTANPNTLLNVPNLNLIYGENKINAQGRLSDKSDFHLNIQAPNLRGLYPELSASLNGQIAMSGKLSSPTFDADLKGQQLQFQDLHINKFALKSNIQSEQQIQGQLNLDVEGFSQSEIKFNQIKLSASGNEKNHQLQLRSNGEPVSAQLNLTGVFDRNSQQWKGIISQTDINTPVGHLKTNQFNLAYDNQTQKATISAHCWNNPDVELCFPQSFSAGKSGEVPFEIKKFNLDLVNKLASQEMLKGSLRSKGKFAWFENKPFQASLDINGDNLNFSQTINGKAFRLAIPKLNLNGQLENNNLALKSALQLAKGELNADLKLSDIMQSRKLSGNLRLHNINLDMANQLLANNDKVAGNLKADLNLGGNVNAPLLNGEIRASGLNAKMHSLPFDLTGGDIVLRFHGNHSTLLGNLQSPDGRLEINGDASWKNINSWNTRIHAKADQFRLDIPSIAKIKLSPDVEMRATPKLLELSGMVDIPWARIAIESLPESAVSVSSDEVILDGSSKRDSLPKLPSKTAEGMLIKSNLKIKVGDDVSLKAYGLNSKLNGILDVRQEKNNLGLFGQINMKNGRYASFGQDLLIRKGQVSFSGLPSQPQLNIEAIRNPEAMEDSKVIAGVRVIGIADAPQVTVFSEPGLPQDQALAYLLTGRSLENSGEAGSGGSIAAALLGMGLAKSGKAVGKIGETFGIKDLNLGTAGVGDSSKVVVSGNITPRLQVKYGVGLFDGLTEITLRYKLLPQLYLQSVSGVNQAVDLLYQFEF